MRAKDPASGFCPRVIYSTMPVITFVTALGVTSTSEELVSAPEAVFHIAMRGDGWDRSYIAVGTQSFFV